MYKKQNGFSGILMIVIVAVVVVALAGVGFIIVKQSSNSPVTQTTVGNSNAAAFESWAKNNRSLIDGMLATEQKLDPQTFEVLNNYYLKDKNQIVYIDQRGGAKELVQVTQADVNTFQVVGGNYGKDINYVYYGQVIINNADSATFVSVSGQRYDTQDKNNSYVCGPVDVTCSDPSFGCQTCTTMALKMCSLSNIVCNKNESSYTSNDCHTCIITNLKTGKQSYLY